MDGLEDVSGVVVPTGRMAGCMAPATIKVAGALFADDAVGLSPTIPAAIKFCDRVTEWCGINEMQAGIKKCGIMEFLANLAAAPILTENHPLRGALHLSGEALPLVTEYKYLGLGITPRLLVCDLVKTRLRLGAISVHQLLPFLTSSVLPVSMRWQVVRAVILPRLLYGAEVYGMNRALTNSMQTLLNKALMGIVQIKAGRSTVPSAPLWAEFGIAPICALAAGRRARAFRKCFQLKTHIGQIIKEPLRSRCWTWRTGTVRWINRYCRQYFARIAAGVGVDPTDWTVLEPIPLRDLVQASITLREQSIRREHPDRTTALATITYFQGGYGGYQALTKGRVFCRPVDHRGIGLVLRCRIGSYPLAPLLVEVQRLPPYWRNKCPFCRRHVPETLHHLLFTCRSWRHQRRKSGIMGTIAAIIKLQERVVTARAANQAAFDSLGISALSNEALAVSWILGGMHDKDWGVRSYMPRPPSPQQAEDAPPGGASSSSSDEGSAAGHCHQVGRRAHLLKVGMFLTLIAPLRGRRLGPLTEPPTQRLRGGSGPGAPTTTTGQSLVR
jgi:hypothetical protein